MATHPQDWKKIKKLFEAALKKEPAHRSSFLREYCSDAWMRKEIEGLLAEHDEATTLLSTSVSGTFSRESQTVTPALQAGEILAGRFRILRFLAAGGMGEVYEAEDQELREHVAIKTVRPEILSQPNAPARFRREVLLARKVTHSNVCRIYDLFRHTTGGARPSEIVFISMEFLQGITLSTRLKSGGRISTEEALPLVQQMAAALAAAHAVGIVHRDFKPSNVMLVNCSGDTRAVVTDFGLASRSLETDERTTVSSGLGIVGTPAYLSPEQIEGNRATPASDIYALGLVIYEMVTGARPFHADTPRSEAFRRLSEIPASPRKIEPDLETRWETTILRCLERNPAHRFPNVTDVAESLTGKAVTQTRRYSNVVFLGSVLLALLAGAAIYFLHLQNRSREPSSGGKLLTQPVNSRPSVAVLGFRDLSAHSDTAWLSTALSEMLTTDLAAGEQLRMIPGENVARTKISLSLPDSDAFAKDTLDRLRKNLNTDYVVIGSYFESGAGAHGQVRVDLRLQDARAGETIASLSETGSETQLLDLVSRTGMSLRQKLGVPSVSPTQAEGVQASVAASPDAARLYAQGLAKLRVSDVLRARDLLEKAVAAEPKYPLSHSALAEAWERLGYDVKAKDEARIALDLSSSLSREERLSVEARSFEIGHDWEKASELYRSLFSFFPDNTDYGLRLAGAQRRGGKGKDALATLAALRRPGTSGTEDPRIDLAEALAAQSLGDFTGEQAAASRAANKSQILGAHLLLAEAELDQCWALRNLGRFSEALATCRSAEQTYAGAGDRFGVAKSLTQTGTAFYEHGDLTAAQDLFGKALVVFMEVGDQRRAAITLNDIANVLADRGDHGGAARYYEQSFAISRRIDSKVDESIALGNIGIELRMSGNLAGAKAKFREAVTLDRETGSEDNEARHLDGLGNTLYLEGQLGEAENVLDHSVAICTRIRLRKTCAFALTYSGDVLAAEGNLDRAGEKYREALEIWSDIGNRIEAGVTRVLMAGLSIDQGHAADAESPAREAISIFAKEGMKELEFWARGVLARALLEQGRAEEARSQLDPVKGHEASIQIREVGFELAAVTALVRAASGNPAERIAATSSLEIALAQAEEYGYVPYQFEIRLALGEIEMKSGRGAAARSRLAALRKDASLKGFGLIAQRAATLQ